MNAPDGGADPARQATAEIRRANLKDAARQHASDARASDHASDGNAGRQGEAGKACAERRPCSEGPARERSRGGPCRCIVSPRSTLWN